MTYTNYETIKGETVTMEVNETWLQNYPNHQAPKDTQREETNPYHSQIIAQRPLHLDLKLAYQRDSEQNGHYEDTSSSNMSSPCSDISDSLASEDGSESSSCSRLIMWRYVLVLLMHTALLNAAFLTNSMPVALVCMVEPLYLETVLGADTSSVYKEPEPTRMIRNLTDVSMGDKLIPVDTILQANKSLSFTQENYEFDWSSETQGIVLTSVVVFAFAGPLVGSWLQTKISNKFIMTASYISAGVLTLLSPSSARRGPYWLAVVRSLIGLLLGSHSPVIGDSLAWWAPHKEKVMMSCATLTGTTVGEIFVPIITSELCADNGWPFIFYVFGGMIIFWSLAWIVLSSRKPDDHPFISDVERDYIISRRVEMNEHKDEEDPPLGEILTSFPVLAYVVCGCFYRWNNLVILTSLPTFLKDCLGYPCSRLMNVGILVSVVATCRMLGSVLWAALIDFLAKRYRSGRARKVCITTGFVTCGLILIGLPFMDRANSKFIVAFLMLAMMLQACGASSLTALPLTMAPRYAGILLSLQSSCGGFFSLSGPLVISYITDKGSQQEWQWAWRLIGAFYILGGVIFSCCGSTDLQPWACHDWSFTKISKGNWSDPEGTTPTKSSPQTPEFTKDYHYIELNTKDPHAANSSEQDEACSISISIDLEKDNVIEPKTLVVHEVPTDSSQLSDSNSESEFTDNYSQEESCEAEDIKCVDNESTHEAHIRPQSSLPPDFSPVYSFPFRNFPLRSTEKPPSQCSLSYSSSSSSLSLSSSYTDSDTNDEGEEE